jgi:hypothetical protein
MACVLSEVGFTPVPLVGCRFFEFFVFGSKVMLEFHHNNGHREGHDWFYVYLHGKAEQFGFECFNDEECFPGSSAPDICIANRPISDYLPVDQYGVAVYQKEPTTLVLHCLVHGHPALAVISNEHCLPVMGGRIALINDIEALKHCLTPKDWR